MQGVRSDGDSTGDVRAHRKSDSRYEGSKGNWAALATRVYRAGLHEWGWEGLDSRFLLLIFFHGVPR
jgi:hypothetical protein